MRSCGESQNEVGACRRWPSCSQQGDDSDAGRWAEILPTHRPAEATLTQLIQPGSEFGQLFRGFQHTAFRFEARDRYDVPHENDSLRRFLAGDPDDLPWLQDWLAALRQHAAEGRRFSRVRVVSVPLTDYSRFGLWCAQFTSAAGEDIRYLTRDLAEAEALPVHDYWLFDSRTVVQMHFDIKGRFLGGEVIDDPAVIVEHNYWRDAARHWAVRRDNFAA